MRDQGGIDWFCYTRTDLVEKIRKMEPRMSSIFSHIIYMSIILIIIYILYHNILNYCPRKTGEKFEPKDDFYNCRDNCHRCFLAA